MAVEGFAFPADDLAEPLADERAVDVVVVGPALVAGVVGRVDVDALDLPGVVREKGLEGFKVVALDDQVAAAGVAAGEVRHVFEQAEGHLLVMVYDGFFSDPIQCGHSVKSRVATRAAGNKTLGTGRVQFCIAGV